uniref:ARAD1C28534p n=1 Tax=Blastobotrys adeninivorans TaxID=409370 RepID=A0A060T8D6_BLAAD
MTMSEADKLKAEGNAAFAAKDFEKAIELFTKAIEASSEPNHVLYSNRSGSYASLKQFDQALKDAEEAVRIKPDWAKGYGRKGTALHGLGDLVSARDAFEAGLKVDPSNAQLQSGLKSVDDAIAREASQDGTSPDMGVGQLFNSPDVWAKLSANSKTKDFVNDPSFVAEFKKLQANPMAALTTATQDPRLMAAISVLLGIDMNAMPGDDVKMGEPEAAEAPKPQQEKKQEEPKKAEPEKKEPEPVDEDKVKADEEKAQGNALYKKRQFDEAIAHYNAAWEIKKDITYLTNRAAAEYEKGDYDACIKTCEEAVSYGREVFADYKLIAKAFSRIGSAYLKKDDYKTGIDYFNKSLTEHRNPDTLTKLRQAEKDLKRREQEAYINPEKAEEARAEGNEKFKNGDAPGAVKCYTEAIRRAPQDPRGYANRAAAYLKLMSYPEVIKDCDEAIARDSSFFKAYTRKATAYIVMREYRKAIETLDQAREVDSELKHTQEINDLYNKAMTGRFQSQEGETPEQTLERVSKDPEVMEILQDPVMNSILQQAQNNPAALRDHMKNPEVAKKINLLAAAGIIRTR